jgi:enoyl-CoA hydratase/carnithine racemase
MYYYALEQTQRLHQQTFAYLLVEEANHVLTLTLNRPEKKNALNPTLLREIAYAITYAHHAPEIWVVVIKALGNVWCAGMDLKAMQGGVSEDTSSIPDPNSPIVIGALMAGLHKPCIAVVHAPVYAGGVLIVGGCTHVLAAEQATFSLPEVKRGLFPFQVLNTLVGLMPARQALDWCMRGRTLTAAQAATYGLVTQVEAPERLEAATAVLVAEFLQYSPTAIRLGLEAYQAMQQLPPEERPAYLHAQFLACQQTTDAQEGIAAFTEKRPPAWTGH